MISNLEVIDWKVDCFLSHTAPTKIVKDKWLFGNMHKEWISKDKKFRGLYQDVIELKL